MLHDKYIFSRFFNAVIDDKKKFEVRNKVDGYSEGDILVLRELDEVEDALTGRCCICTVDYVLDDEKYCLPGKVILGITVQRIYNPFCYFCGCKCNENK